MKVRSWIVMMAVCLMAASLHGQATGKMVHFPGAAGRTNNQIAVAAGTLTSDPESQTLVFTQGGKPGLVIAYWQVSGIEANSAGDTVTVHYKNSSGEQAATFSASAVQGQSLISTLKTHIPNATVTTNSGLQRLRLPARTNNQSTAAQPAAAARTNNVPRTNNQ